MNASFHRNISKIGGWSASQIKRIYVLSLNGDSHWQKWAEIMPVDKIKSWEEWGHMSGLDGTPFPGNGKLYRLV